MEPSLFIEEETIWFFLGGRLNKALPAFFAARNNTFSTRCWAGSPSGDHEMKCSTSKTASSFVKY